MSDTESAVGWTVGDLRDRRTVKLINGYLWQMFRDGDGWTMGRWVDPRERKVKPNIEGFLPIWERRTDEEMCRILNYHALPPAKQEAPRE